MLALLDFEASGLHATSYPVEVAFVSSDLSCGYSACIRPHDSWSAFDWSRDAAQVHGLDLDALTAFGEDVGTVASHLNLGLGCRLVGQPDVRVTTDNLRMDGFWSRRLFDAAGLPMDFDLPPPGRVWTAAEWLWDAGRAVSHALKVLGPGKSNDVDHVVAARLAGLGGGEPLYREHAELAAAMAAECGLVEHRALDDVLVHALCLSAADLLSMRPEDRAAARADAVRRAGELKRTVERAQASRLSKLRGGEPLERPRAVFEARPGDAA
jgi:hypothetical protein